MGRFSTREQSLQCWHGILEAGQPHHPDQTGPMFLLPVPCFNRSVSLLSTYLFNHSLTFGFLSLGLHFCLVYLRFSWYCIIWRHDSHVSCLIFSPVINFVLSSRDQWILFYVSNNNSFYFLLASHELYDISVLL